MQLPPRFLLPLAALACAFAIAPPAPAGSGDNQAPVCVDGLSVVVECQGATTIATVDASASFDPDGDPISFLWAACPGSFVVDPTAPITQVVIDTSANCSVTCGVRVRVTDSFGAHNACRTYVIVVPGDDGCTPGYWKNHLDAWGPTGFAPTDDFDTVFGVDAFNPDRSLLRALQTGGGGLDKLGRHGTAALLNAAHPGVASTHSIGYILTQVGNAITTGQYEPLASDLDADNNLGCPLN